MDCFSVPNLAVFQAKLLWAESSQESELCPDAEIGDDYVKGLV